MLERIIEMSIQRQFDILKEEMFEILQRQNASQRYLTRKEAAIYLSCCESTIDSWSLQGKITKIYFGKSPRFDREEIDQFLNLKRKRS